MKFFPEQWHLWDNLLGWGMGDRIYNQSIENPLTQWNSSNEICTRLVEKPFESFSACPACSMSLKAPWSAGKEHHRVLCCKYHSRRFQLLISWANVVGRYGTLQYLRCPIRRNLAWTLAPLNPCSRYN